MKINCAVCGVEFETSRPKRKTCGHECFKQYRNQYLRQHRNANKEKTIQHNKEHYDKNRNRYIEQQKQKRKRDKIDVMDAYGGKCAICGESHIEFLTIDHSFNDGAEHRKKIKSSEFYRWLKKNKYPKNLGLRVLCFNCNCSMGAYGYSPKEKGMEGKFYEM